LRALLFVKWELSVNSTNNFFEEAQIFLNNYKFFIKLADLQTSGRGRENRSWISPKGGLWFTIYTESSSPKENLKLHFASSIAVHTSLNKLFGINTILKWPNDIYFKDKKLCGILTEAKNQIAAIGIGLNLNNSSSLTKSMIIKTPSDTKFQPISCKDILSRAVTNEEKISLLLEIVKNMNNLKSLSLEEIVKIWKSNPNILGKSIYLKTNGKIIHTKAVDLTPEGALICESDKGKNIIYTGDILGF